MDRTKYVLYVGLWLDVGMHRTIYVLYVGVWQDAGMDRTKYVRYVGMWQEPEWLVGEGINLDKAGVGHGVGSHSVRGL